MGWEAEGEAGGGDRGRLLGLGGEGGQQAEEAETGASWGRDAQGTVRARAQAGVCELWGVGSWCVSQAPGEDVRTACSTVSVPVGVPLAVVLPPPARGPGTLIPSAQRFVWAAKQPLGKAALGALFA